jgi:hypothetical protein
MVRNTIDDVARRGAENILEGYRKGGHTCQECGRVSVWIGGFEEYKNKVKSLLLEKGVQIDFEEDWIFDGLCRDCRWRKLGTGLDVRIMVQVTREGKESVIEIIEGVKSRLEGLGLPFKITGVERVHRREERGWQ